MYSTRTWPLTENETKRDREQVDVRQYFNNLDEERHGVLPAFLDLAQP